jgi:signal transduction histidine kinase
LLKDEQQAHLGTKAELITRDEFLAIVSHDLRNPIGTVLTCSRMLLEGQSGAKFDQATMKWIQLIKRNADSALHLINDLIDVERMSIGKLELIMGEHDICKLIAQAVENVNQEADKKLISLRAFQSTSPMMVWCDRDRIMQVLLNLIGNALKFTPAHGSITVDSQITENTAIEVSISDTGPGIPADKTEAIFERFSQLGNKDRLGLGLGLYISKQIVNAHSGRIWVTSIEGEGSRFAFTLPGGSHL